MLSQYDDDNVLRPIAYAGRAFTPAEGNYTTTEQELLAVIFSFKHFRVYLEGNKFELQTDHSALKWILGQKDLTPRLARWALILQGYSFSIKHVKGSLNVVPDAISRMEHTETHTKVDDDIENFPDLNEMSDCNLKYNDTSPGESDILDAMKHPEVTSTSIAKSQVIIEDTSQNHVTIDNVFPTEHHDSDSNIIGKSNHVTFANTLFTEYYYNNNTPIQFDNPLTNVKINSTNQTLQPCIKRNKYTSGTSLRTITPDSTSHSFDVSFIDDHDGISRKTQKSNEPVGQINSLGRAGKRRNKLRQSLENTAQNPFNIIDVSPENIRREQRHDPQCKAIIDFLKFGIFPRDDKKARAILLRQEDYIVIDYILYHIYTYTGPKKSTTTAQVVVPQNLKQHLLTLHHDSSFAGHIGTSKMISVLRNKLYWVGMIKDIHEYVSTCPSCNATKSTSYRAKPPLTLRDPAPHAFHTMLMDTVGPLPKSHNGNYHIVCVTDMYSRYILAWATPDIKAATIARQFYEKVICVFGTPRILLSDNGKAFTSEMFKYLSRCYNIKQIFSTAYHAKSQGQVERAQRSLVSLLRNFVDTKQRTWDTFIPSVLFSLNSSDSYSIGYSSYFMLFGRHPVFPSDVHLPDPLEMPKTVSEQLKP